MQTGSESVGTKVIERGGRIASPKLSPDGALIHGPIGQSDCRCLTKAVHNLPGTDIANIPAIGQGTASQNLPGLCPDGMRNFRGLCQSAEPYGPPDGERPVGHPAIAVSIQQHPNGAITQSRNTGGHREKLGESFHG